MSDTGKSSNNIVDTLKFAMLPTGAIAVPGELFDEHVPFDRDSLALFAPLIVRKDGDVFRIIDGCKRFKTLAALGRTDCACMIVEAPLDALGAGLMRIALNSGRTHHLREQFLFVRWCKANTAPAEYAAHIDRLKIAPNVRHDLEELAGCSDTLIEAALSGTIDPAVAPEMAHLDLAATEAFLSLFTAIPFSRQAQRELTEWLHEIAFTERMSVAALLASDMFAGTIASTKLNAPQKAARIHELAHERRFPLLSAAKKQFAAHSRSINPAPGTVTFQSSPYFEKKSLEVRIRLTDPEKAAALMARLASIDTADWEKLIDPTVMISGPGA